MLNMYSAADAITVERQESRKQTRLEWATPKVDTRFRTRGAKINGRRLEDVENEVRVRDRRELIQDGIGDFTQFMQEPKKEPLVFETGFIRNYPEARKKLPTVRVFRLEGRGRLRRWVEHLRFCD